MAADLADSAVWKSEEVLAMKDRAGASSLGRFHFS
jgi:hypothetical protein